MIGRQFGLTLQGSRVAMTNSGSYYAVLRRMGAIALALLLLNSGMSTSLASAGRFSELEENNPASSRCEELTFSHRVSPQRLLRMDAGRALAALSVLSPHMLGHDQHPVLFSLRGHRLPNGLLAPITC